MSAFPSDACAGALAGAGAPAAFRAALRVGTADTDAIDVELRRVCALDVAPPELVSGPLLGRALAELTGCGPTPEESEMDYGREPRHGRSPEAVTRPVCPEPVTKPARPPRPVAAPSGCRPRAERAPAMAGKPAATPDLCKIDTERLRGLAGAPPAPARTPARRTAPPVEPLVAPRREKPVPAKVDAACELPALLARGAAERVSADCAPALTRALGKATRPGPAAPLELLERLAFERFGQAHREPRERQEETRRSAAWQEGTPRPAVRPPEPGPTAHPVATPTPVPERVRPVAPPDAEHEPRTPKEFEVDKAPKRLSAQFAELPDIPRREWVSAPGRSNPDDVAKPSSPPENTVSEADLELMMHRILDNAARRHGIEV